MATVRPFAYNTGASIPGTDQLGNLAIGVADMDYSEQPGGVVWWNGPDEDLGYVITHPDPSGNQPNPLLIPAYVGFWRSEFKTDISFIELAQWVSEEHGTPQVFGSGDSAKTWLNTNGYWTSYGSGGPSTGDYILLAEYSPADNNGDITFPNHNATNWSLNPNLIGQSGYAIYINGNDALGNDMSSILGNLIGNSGTLTLTQGSNTVVYSFTNTAFENGGYGGNQYYYDNTYETGTVGDVAVITPASSDFNTVDPITISVVI